MPAIKEVLDANWLEERKNPLIQPPFPSPIIGDPSFLDPAQTPDGRWYLFAYSFWGIHMFISNDGISWKNTGVVANKSIRPFILKHKNTFYLLSERILSFLPSPHTQIEIRESADLKKWSDPVTILKPELSWQFEGSKLGTVGNPCLTINEEGNYLLYYSAGLVFLSDCFFWEPKYIGLAISNNIFSGYESTTEPIIVPSYNDKYCNLGAGSVKVLKLDDGYVGFQNGIYWDNDRGHSGSAIRVLTSKNGVNWVVSDEPILKPDYGWKKSHVYALDVKIVENQWIMYFNARSGWVLGKERIGRIIAERPSRNLVT